MIVIIINLYAIILERAKIYRIAIIRAYRRIIFLRKASIKKIIRAVEDQNQYGLTNTKKMQSIALLYEAKEEGI